MDFNQVCFRAPKREKTPKTKQLEPFPKLIPRPFAREEPKAAKLLVSSPWPIRNFLSCFDSYVPVELMSFFLSPDL